MNQIITEKIRNKSDNESIIAYTSDKIPLNRQQYVDAINKGIKQIEEGKFITHNELMKTLYSKFDGKYSG